MRLGIVRQGDWVDSAAVEIARHADAVVLAVGYAMVSGTSSTGADTSDDPSAGDQPETSESPADARALVDAISVAYERLGLPDGAG